MIHRGSISIDNEVKAAQNLVTATGYDLDLSMELYLKKIKIGKKKILELLGTDTYLYAKEALRYGFVDKII